ncbi:MAG TPA: hypothetical protein VH143_30840 [Kofleriaceae bacterium]|jgi:DNA-binding response OmpR family regulator|nr:hypothetical protein [Kofleriaceae bacterium]
MKVLVASSDPALRSRLTDWLVAAHHEVVAADCTSSACRALESKPDVVVVDWLLGGGGAALVDYARRLDARHRHYVIVVCPRPRPSEIIAFVEVGADDFTCTSASCEEMLARVDAPRRIRDWTARPMRTQTIRLRKLLELDGRRIWREIDSIVTTEIGEMLGLALEPEQRVDTAIRWCGAVPLTLNGEHVELQLGVGLADAGEEQFAQDVLGADATEAAIEDALREIANVAGGAVKRAALGDGLVMTIGLPTDDDVFAMANARRWASTTASGLRLTFAIAATPAQLRSMRCGELHEGMVVAREIRDTAGHVVAAAGTRLTATTVERLVQVLGANACIEVATRGDSTASAA